MADLAGFPGGQPHSGSRRTQPVPACTPPCADRIELQRWTHRVHDTGDPASMSAAAAHVPSRSSVARLATERSLALASIGLVGLHIADDNFLQPEPGMSAVDHLPGGLALLAFVA